MAKMSRLQETTACPKCGAKKKKPCVKPDGRLAKNAHSERHAVMVGKKADKNIKLTLTININ